ncbi:MAG: AMP-binding protein [Candidatus Rokuibacteriota bacterium]
MVEPSRASGRPWAGAWPSHLARALDYPAVPAWWILEQNLPRFAERVAVREVEPETLAERRVLTYEQLVGAARGIATGLRGLGVGRGTRVGYCLPNGAALILGYYATWWAGGTVVPTNPGARHPEVEQLLADADVSLVVGLAHGPAQVAAGRLQVPFVDLGAFAAMEQLDPAPPVACAPADDIAVLLYTGGTTGTPKGAMLTHRNIVTNTVQFAQWYAFSPGDETSLGAIPFFHSGGMSGVMNVPLSAGATLIVFPRFRAATVARAVSRYGVTRLFGVPTMYIALLDDAEGRRADYSRLRACRTNAAPLPPSVKAAFDRLVGREVLVEGYGLTEASPLTHANPIHRAKPGSIGFPLPDTDARIVDLGSGAEVALGEPGELLIRGPQVMRGYWRRPDETARALASGWLHTGDVATMDADGYFAIVDRAKDMINTAGFKVWPREVEEVIYGHEAVKLAVAVGVPDDYRGEVVKAFVVLKKERRGGVSETEILEFCRARLSTYKVPRILEFRTELPLSGAGKLLRRALRDEALATPPGIDP